MNPKSVTSVYLKISNHQSNNQKSKPAANAFILLHNKRFLNLLDTTNDKIPLMSRTITLPQ